MFLLRSYYNSFKGLRVEVWWLALVTLINRAGTMVIPFLSLYLTDERHFTLADVGWVMTSFGVGSLAGSWLGGKLTDRIGHRPVMFWSLAVSGLLFVLFQFIEGFTAMCLGIFVIMLFADAFRPAMFVSLAAYCKPENRARSVTLVRLAINLGFAFGPAVGGVLIATAGYGGLFWIDGITCILAAFVFVLALKPKENREEVKEEEKPKLRSPYADGPFLLFIVTMTVIVTAFLQLFSTLPLYFRDVHFLSEDQIGYLMAFNAGFIFLLEMPLIKYFERPQFSVMKILFISTLLFAFSFFVLNTTAWSGILIISILFLSVGEMLNFPFGNAFAMERSATGKQGDYMALYTMGFAVSHIVGHNAGMHLIDWYGYETTWYIMGGVLVFAAGMILVLKRRLKRESLVEAKM